MRKGNSARKTPPKADVDDAGNSDSNDSAYTRVPYMEFVSYASGIGVTGASSIRWQRDGCEE